MPTPPHQDEGDDGSTTDVLPIEPAPTSDRPSRAVPPPIPRGAATRRGIPVPTQAMRWDYESGRPELRARLESPTVLDRALHERAAVDLGAKAAELERVLGAGELHDRGQAALLAYELGELYEMQLLDDDRALVAYRRAAELDGTLRSATWSLRRLLYRRRELADVAKVIDQELATSMGDERNELLIERAAVRDGDARGALETLLGTAPGHQVALLLLERLRAASDDLPDVWRQLADVVRHPVRKLGYLLDLAWATRSGFDAAARVAGKRGAVEVAQQQLRCIATGGSAAEIEGALEAYSRALIDVLDKRSPQSAAMERELVAVCWLLARHLRADRPSEAWVALEQASAVSRGEPIVIVEQIELARAAGQAAEVPNLVQAWKSVEDAEARQATMSRWSALGFGDRERRAEWRALVADAQPAVPGWIVGAAVAECDVLTSPGDAAARSVLAERYLTAARAAARGTWLGGERGQPDPMAAATLYVQAAEVFAHFLAGGSDVESAHSALDEARELVPDHPAVLEASVELEDSAGEPQEAIERLRSAATSEDAAPLVRALRIARTHGLVKVVFEIERGLLDRAFDVRVAWEHETTLMQLGRDDERVELLLSIARSETDHHRKYMALLGAARLNSRLGLGDTAIDLLRELRDLEPQQQFPREALIDALRRARMWAELVIVRTSELETGNPRLRAALREIAWVQEVCLGDQSAAARAYADWALRMPTDQKALEGLARCSALIGDTAAAVRAHEALAGEDRPETARWLLARSLARAGMFERAIEEYRELTANGREHVALTAALTVVALATRREDGALRAFGALEIASRTTDSRLASALYEEVGWFSALTSGETDRAATSFAEAVIRDPERTGAIVGCMLSAAAQSDGGELARRCVELAENVEGELAVALKLRAAAVALTEGDSAFAEEELLAARSRKPESAQAKFVILEVDLEQQDTRSGQFSVTDNVVERGNLFAARAELVEDPRTRAAFELDRAEMLDAAGLAEEAVQVVTSVVQAFPGDRRALLALRRLTRETNPAAFARATDALVKATRDAAWQRELRSDSDGGSARERRNATPPSGFEETTLPESVAFGGHANDDGDDALESDTVLLDSTALQDEELEVARTRAPSIDTMQGGIEKLVEAYAREAELATDSAERAGLWTEVGRLHEHLGDSSRAAEAYRTALAADARWSRALRGARRLAYRDRDMTLALTLLGREAEVATGLERRALQRLRSDLLLATRDFGAARGVIDELIAEDPDDAAAWSASLVTAHVSGDTQAMAAALTSLARISPALTTALDVARGQLRGRTGSDIIDAEDVDATIGRKWQTIWDALARADAAACVAAALDLALHVEGEDPTFTTALAMFAQMHASESGTLAPELYEPALEAAKLSGRTAPREPIVVRLAAETALLANDLATAAHSFAQWTRTKADPAERAYAAARAAELEPTRLGRMWSTVVEQDPDDDYAVAKLRAHHIAAGKLEDAIALELKSAREGDHLVSMIDAAEMMVEETRTDEAVALLQEARTRWPSSLAAVEAHADTLASVGRWAERAKVLDEAASVRGPAVGARDVLHLRAAAAWDLATNASETSGERAQQDMITFSALLACERVLADNPASVFAHGTALKLAGKLPTRQSLAGVLARLAAVEPSPWAKSSLALRRIRAIAPTDPDDARDTARTSILADDPRWSVSLSLAFHPPLSTEVALALAASAERCEGAGRTTEAATLWMRAAYVAAETGEVDRALALCARFAPALPRVAADLERVLGKDSIDGGALGLTRLVRDADDAARRGDAEAAFAAAKRALDLRPGDPVTLLGHALVGARLGKPVRAAAEQLEVAEAAQDAGAQLSACEYLARTSVGLGEREGVINLLRNALRFDPSRVDLQAWLERELAAAGDLTALVHLRRDVVLRTAKWATADRVAMLVDTALVSLCAGEQEDIVRACREVLVLEPLHALALRQVESALRQASPSAELVYVYEQTAKVLDHTSSAVAHLRAGQVSALLGNHGDAAAAFTRALTAAPTFAAVLDAWRASALASGRSSDLLAIARHQDLTGAATAAEFHLAGVALMDGPGGRANADDAIAALRRVLELDPTQADAFCRLWMMLDTLGRREELVDLLRGRVAVATDRHEKIELHRELAERLFVTNPSLALQHYRHIVTTDPTDVRAHAAIADLASAHAPWSSAADAVAARISLEREPRVVHPLLMRLGALYADHDDTKALDAYQRAAEQLPHDTAATEQVARIAVRQAAWPLALAASERLVTSEKDPTKLAEHLVRSATVFASGFSNTERASRMLLLALETAPTSTAALDALVELFARRDPIVLRGQLDQVVTRSRRLSELEPTNGAAYRMLSRASAARAAMGETSALVTARAAAEMAALFGAAETNEAALLVRPPPTGRARLAQPEMDEVLFPASVPAAILAMLRVAAPAIKLALGMDLAALGLQRKQRQRATDPLVVTVRPIAAVLGLGDIDVYLAPHPHVTLAEPGDPPSLLIGHAVAQSESRVEFSAGAALKLAQMSLAIPARLNESTLQAVIAVLFDVAGVSIGTGTPETQTLATQLRRHISPTMRTELKRHARTLQIEELPAVVRELQMVGLRAGFACSGQLRAGLDYLAGLHNTTSANVLAGALARDLVGFALSEKAALLLTSG